MGTASSALWSKAFLWCSLISFEHWKTVRSVSIGLLCRCTAYKSEGWSWGVSWGGLCCVALYSAEAYMYHRSRSQYLLICKTGPPRPPGSSVPHFSSRSHMSQQGWRLQTRRPCTAQPTGVSTWQRDGDGKRRRVQWGLAWSVFWACAPYIIDCMRQARWERV